MSEIRPVACADRGVLNWYDGGETDKQVDLYALPDSHRIVSVELLEDLEEACAIAEYWGLLESLQAIIDKEQS
jgi:hypothetical protein